MPLAKGMTSSLQTEYHHLGCASGSSGGVSFYLGAYSCGLVTAAQRVFAWAAPNPPPAHAHSSSSAWAGGLERAGGAVGADHRGGPLALLTDEISVRMYGLQLQSADLTAVHVHWAMLGRDFANSSDYQYAVLQLRESCFVQAPLFLLFLLRLARAPGCFGCINRVHPSRWACVLVAWQVPT